MATAEPDTPETAAHDGDGGAPPTAHDAKSLTALQCELRALFLNRPTNRALVEALGRIGEFFDAEYAVVHARLGVHLLSEEWMKPGLDYEGATREAINNVLWSSMAAESARGTRLDGTERPLIVLTAMMYDQDVEPSGGAALVVPELDRIRTLHALAQLEGVLGYLGLLVAGVTQTGTVAERREIHPTAAANHPARLAFAIVSEVQTRHGFELTSVGYVRGNRAEVVAISGVSEVRAANPGVALIRAAMEECLDRGAPIVHSGRGDETEDEDDCRLHGQWSASLHGCPVASFPLTLLDDVVAVVSISGKRGTGISTEQIAGVAEEMSGYAALVPLARSASRGLLAHAVDAAKSTVRRITASGWRRVAILTALLSAVTAWLCLGRIDYVLTVPCVVKATNRRSIACPRDGVLAELFVRPGDHVRAGQLLAVLDANTEYLRRTELRSEVDSLDALADKALADRDTGQLRIHVARKRSLLSQLAIVEANIALAQIRAPQNGVILDGDLRERIGGRLSMGDAMFELARYDQAAVAMRIPQAAIVAARKTVTARFSPAARPDEAFELQRLRIAPASTVIDGDNTFLGEAIVPAHLGRVAPGMEGVARLNTGPRSAWWVLTHRVTDWLRLNFWL